ncbi:MAG: GON domain-containing protein [Polyangia bacterium]
MSAYKPAKLSLAALCAVACGGATTQEGLWPVSVSASTPGGLVFSEPAGLSCGSTCSASFPSGTVLRLTATPPPGMDFVGWQGACQGSSATCELVVTQAAQVAVQYQPAVPLSTLIVTKSGAGAGRIRSEGGIDCGAACSLKRPAGSQVTLTAEPEVDSIFAGWSGACTGSARTCTVTLGPDLGVNAAFEKPQSCAQIPASFPQAPSGSYTLFINGDANKPWAAYCQIGASTSTYLSLQNVTTGNYSQYTAGGGRTGTNVRTSFQRLRIDPNTLIVDCGDLTFSSSYGQINHPDGSKTTQMAYGSAQDCASTSSSSGVGSVDLSGTPFAVAASAFGISGYSAQGSASYSADSRVVNLRGGGFCGGIFAKSGTLQLVYQP